MYILAVVTVSFSLGWLIRDLGYFLRQKPEEQPVSESTPTVEGQYYEAYELTPSDR